MLPSGHFQPNHIVHPSKIRRIWTFTRESNPHNQHQQSFNDDFPHFKQLTQYQTSIPNKKDNFASSLINKLRSVERAEKITLQNKQPIFNKPDFHANLKNRQKGSNQSSRYHVHPEWRGDTRIHSNGPPQHINHSNNLKILKQASYEELKEENLILKEKMNEFIVQNEKLKARFSKYLQDLQQKEDEVVRRENELDKRECDLKLREQFLSLQTVPLKEQQKILQDQLFFITFSNWKLETSKKFLPSKQVDEVVLPAENEQLAKAIQQIRQLKVEKLQMQKKFMTALNQYRKKKEEEIEKIKRGFTNNLAHYKDLLLKLSIKPTHEIKKYQQDTFQTVILETSSADQS